MFDSGGVCGWGCLCLYGVFVDESSLGNVCDVSCVCVIKEHGVLVKSDDVSVAFECECLKSGVA